MNAVLSILMLAMIALLVGAVFAWRKGIAKKQVFLMVLLAAVMGLNVAIWLIPDGDGNAPVTKLPNQQSE